MANLNQLPRTRLIISITDKTTLRNTVTSPDTLARIPHKGAASRYPRLNCPEISENYPPMIILANKKQRKVPVLQAVNDKNKKIIQYTKPIGGVQVLQILQRHLTGFQNFIAFLNSGRAKCFDVVRNKFPYFWSLVQKRHSGFVN